MLGVCAASSWAAGLTPLLYCRSVLLHTTHLEGLQRDSGGLLDGSLPRPHPTFLHLQPGPDSQPVEQGGGLPWPVLPAPSCWLAPDVSRKRPAAPRLIVNFTAYCGTACVISNGKQPKGMKDIQASAHQPSRLESEP